MRTGKAKKDIRLQNLNTWSDEFRPLNQGPSSSRSPPPWVLLCRLSTLKKDPSSATEGEDSLIRLRS
ncbi:hypothetical protein AXF42_Ash011460 [Apostasia shenzhenica]|uniref:Uncharacterized protein n=1 Tax=Apostasia shenzhenica TaxID=1088818 RepID=A0A2I0BAN1_9ASPA|nr:hypothetical protein AXF42_Ash011460 [Apostasia shenzhenica]